MQIKIYSKSKQKENKDFLSWVIMPNQTHFNNIVEIITWKENLNNCDGVFTSKQNNFKLAIKTADCSAIVFYDDKRYWIVHAGWRWLVNWIIEKMMIKFDNPQVFVAPFLKSFEIQKDFCYDAIYKKFWDKFFEIKETKIIFDFEKALKSVLPKNAIFDKRDTFSDLDFYSYRRNKTKKRNYIVLEK